MNEKDRPCPTCTWPSRETVNGICQTCGTNYSAEMPGKGEWMTAHVMPRGDLVEHEASDDCPCGPASVPVTCEDGSVGWNIIHHSLDGREASE